MPDFSALWQRAAVAELCWVAADGPTGIPVVPLWLGGRACVALPYSTYDDVAGLGKGPVAFAVTITGENAVGAAVATGRVEVWHDFDGQVFIPELLPQEVVKYPPTRLLADGLMAQRDHWWWMGRMIVTLTGIDDERGLPGRDRPQDAVLVASRVGRPAVQVVTARHWPEATGPLGLFGRDGSPLAGRGEAAFAFGHARSPDAEQWLRWHRRGRLIDEELRVSDAAGSPAGQLAPMSTVQWFRNHRSRARECKRGLSRARRALAS